MSSMVNEILQWITLKQESANCMFSFGASTLKSLGAVGSHHRLSFERFVRGSAVCSPPVKYATPYYDICLCRLAQSENLRKKASPKLPNTGSSVSGVRVFRGPHISFPLHSINTGKGTTVEKATPWKSLSVHSLGFVSIK